MKSELLIARDATWGVWKLFLCVSTGSFRTAYDNACRLGEISFGSVLQHVLVMRAPSR